MASGHTHPGGYDSAHNTGIKMIPTRVLTGAFSGQFQNGTLDNLTITGRLMMPGSQGSIRIGTTPPTGPAAGTGIWIDRTGIFGLASNVQQFYLSAATGKAMAGGGAVALATDGITINVPTAYTAANAIKMYDVTGGLVSSAIWGVVPDPMSNNPVDELHITTGSSSSSRSGLFEYKHDCYGMNTRINLIGYDRETYVAAALSKVALSMENTSGPGAGDPWSSTILLHALTRNAAGNIATVTLKSECGGSNETLQVSYATGTVISTDLRVGGGLHVGSTATNPADDTITADGAITGAQLISNIATGTAPLVVTSTTKVTNLNADTVDGYDLSQPLGSGDGPTFNHLHVTNNVAAGSLTVDTTTLVVDDWNHRVGIGTNEPDALLCVWKADGAAGDLIHLRNSSDLTDLAVRYNGSGGYQVRTEIGGAGNPAIEISSAGHVGICGAPSYPLHVVGTGYVNGLLSCGDAFSGGGYFNVAREGANYTQVMFVQSNDSATYFPGLYFRKSKGSIAAPSTVDSASTVYGIVAAQGRHSSGWATAASITFKADGTPSGSSDMPGKIVFATTPDGSGSAVDRLTLGGNGTLTFADACDIAVNTTTGTKIGTAAGQKLGLYGVAPVAQQSHIGDQKVDYEGSQVDTGNQTATAFNLTNAAINAILVRLENLGIVATS